jgi:opacity protein-like surface antigen
MSRATLWELAALLVLTTCLTGSANAADPAQPEPSVPRTGYPNFEAPPAFSWTGFYAGVNLGAAWNTQQVSSSFGSPWSTTNIGFIGGIQGGYNYQIGHLVLGVEGELDWLSNTQRPVPVGGGFNQINGQWNWTSNLGFRFGFAADTLLIYGKVGYGWATQTLAINSPIALGSTTTFVSSTNGGELMGVGIEYAFPGSAWTVKSEYDYVLMANKKFVVSFPNTVTVTPNLQMFKVGINLKM